MKAGRIGALVAAILVSTPLTGSALTALRYDIPLDDPTVGGQVATLLCQFDYMFSCRVADGRLACGGVSEPLGGFGFVVNLLTPSVSIFGQEPASALVTAFARTDLNAYRFEISSGPQQISIDFDRALNYGDFVFYHPVATEDALTGIGRCAPP